MVKKLQQIQWKSIIIIIDSNRRTATAIVRDIFLKTIPSTKQSNRINFFINNIMLKCNNFIMNLNYGSVNTDQLPESTQMSTFVHNDSLFTAPSHRMAEKLRNSEWEVQRAKNRISVLSIKQNQNKARLSLNSHRMLYHEQASLRNKRDKEALKNQLAERGSTIQLKRQRNEEQKYQRKRNIEHIRNYIQEQKRNDCNLLKQQKSQNLRKMEILQGDYIKYKREKAMSVKEMNNRANMAKSIKHEDKLIHLKEQKTKQYLQFIKREEEALNSINQLRSKEEQLQNQCQNSRIRLNSVKWHSSFLSPYNPENRKAGSKSVQPNRYHGLLPSISSS